MRIMFNRRLLLLTEGEVDHLIYALEEEIDSCWEVVSDPGALPEEVVETRTHALALIDTLTHIAGRESGWCQYDWWG